MNDLAARIRADQRARWERGEKVRLEEYFDRHPALLTNEELTVDLIYAEALLREEYSEQVDAEDYCSRFPKISAAIQRQFEFHNLWDIATRASKAHSEKLPDLPGYEFLKEIGRGSWGTVYEAVQLSLGRRVAVKLSHRGIGLEAGPHGLRREAELIARIRHPNIVEVYDYGEHEGRAHAVLELVEGGTLAERLKDSLFKPPEAARLVELTARAVHHAHLAGIVHRDLKPANILLTADGTPKVTDFGLARRLGAVSSIATAGEVVGTVAYMAPEQMAESVDKVGPAADVYALGAILYELLEGHPPFGSGDLRTLFSRVLNDRAPALPSETAAGDLDGILAKCLEKSPRHRYTTALALADDLQRFLVGQRVHAGYWFVRVRRFVRRHWRAEVAIMVSVVAIVMGLIGQRQETVDSQPPTVQEIATRLAGGGTFVLVPARGLPRWHRWCIASGINRPAQNEEFTIESWGCGLVELLPDPGSESFLLTAEVRHDESDESGEVGIYIGHEEFGVEGGIHSFFKLSFNDIRPGVPIHMTRYFHTEGGRMGLWDFQVSGIARNPDPPAGRGLTQFRRIALRVSLQDINGIWTDGQPVGRFAIADLEHKTSAQLADIQRRMPGNAFAPLVHPEFRHRGGLGLYVLRGVATFRNVVIEPP